MAPGWVDPAFQFIKRNCRHNTTYMPVARSRLLTRSAALEQVTFWMILTKGRMILPLFRRLCMSESACPSERCG
jgi:hypothetical protein